MRLEDVENFMASTAGLINRRQSRKKTSFVDVRFDETSISPFATMEFEVKGDALIIARILYQPNFA